MAEFNLPFGVRVSNEDPLDSDRYIASDIATRDLLITNGRAYIGMQVFVDPSLYILKNLSPTTWSVILDSSALSGDYLKNITDTFTGVLTLDGSLVINGDIIQDGSSYETHAEQIYTKDDFIIMRDGAISGLVDPSISGIKVLKADGTNDVILGTGSDAVMRVGWEGDVLQALATREDSPGDNEYAYWDDSSTMFKTNEFILENLLDTSIVGKANSDLLQYNTDTSTWDNVIPIEASLYFALKSSVDSSFNDVWTEFGNIDSSFGDVYAELASVDASITRIDASLGILSLVNLTDTSIGTTLADDDVLQYNVDTSTWDNVTVEDASNYFILKTNVEDASNYFILRTNLDSSFGDIYNEINQLDSSIVRIDNALVNYIHDTSLGTSFYWDSGLLEASTGTTINELSDVGDVSIASVNDKDFLQYDVDTSTWINVAGLDASAYFQEKIELKTPASGGTGSQGDLAFDASYLYVCTSSNTWGRLLLENEY